MVGFSPRELEQAMRAAQEATAELKRLQADGYLDQVRAALKGLDFEAINQVARDVGEASRTLSVVETSRELGVSAQTIRKLIEEGRLETLGVGRAFRIPTESIHELQVAARTAAWLRGQTARLGLDAQNVISSDLVSSDRLAELLRGVAVPSPVEVCWLADAIAKHVGDSPSRSESLRHSLSEAADYAWKDGHPSYRSSEQRQRRWSGRDFEGPAGPVVDQEGA